jgi:ParB family chromosome partitioning protein
MKRQALGKGLSSLIPEHPLADREAGLLMLDIDRIQPGRHQPRADFSDLEGLASSIKENGMVQPVIVRQEGGAYRLIAGERRWRAAQLAGLTRIPAVVRRIADDRLLEVALIENIQRKELNPIEEAQAYEILLGEMKLSQGEIARRVGRDRSSISNHLRILKLPPPIRDRIREGTISFGHAKAIMALDDSGTQIMVADEIVRRLLSVRETEERVAEIAKRSGKESGERARPARGARVDPTIGAAEDRLCRALATKVRIHKKSGRGRIEIQFYSDDELDRLFGFLVTAEKGH